MHTKTYSTFVFDVGGTLIKFDEGRRAVAYSERAAQAGIHVSANDVQTVLHTLDAELPARQQGIPLSLMPYAQQRAFWVDFWAEGFRRLGVGDADAMRFADELLDSAHGANFQAVFADCVPALQALQARGKRLGIISNFSPNCEPLLRELGLAQYFDFFIVSGILGIEKPDPRIFHAAVQAAGAPISEIVYVGDSVYHDVQGARDAGMDAILIDRDNQHAERALTRIQDLRELSAF